MRNMIKLFKIISYILFKQNLVTLNTKNFYINNSIDMTYN